MTAAERPWEDAPAHYKSTDAEVLAAWEAAQQGFRDFDKARDEWAAGFPDHEPFVLRSPDAVFLVGLHHERDGESPGEGWRLTNHRTGYACWVPDKRTKLGKELAATIKTLRAKHVEKIPGMPMLTIVENHFYSPGVIVHEATAYVNWTSSFAEVEREGKVDETRWERIKRSEFYAAKEALDDERKASTP